MKSFVKETLARLAGDEKEVISQKNYRKATLIVTGQIGALKLKLSDDESQLEAAEEKLKEAKFPTTLITNNEAYMRAINEAKQVVKAAKKVVADTKHSIAEAEETLAEFEAEV